MRIGIGYDAHRLEENRQLVLGGVEIEFEKGLTGHSDADVLIHAIMDALLGAAAMGDIGKHFSDKDLKYKDISSIVLLEQVNKMLLAENYKINNIDSVIIAQSPKLAPHIEKMRINISRSLNMDMRDVSVKATTEENMGYTGREEGIRAEAVCLIEKIK